MENRLKNRVMRRIYILYGKDLALRYGEYALPIVFVASLFSFVSLQNVITNMPKDNPAHMFNFFVIAIRDTEWIFQAVLAVAALWIAVRTGKLAHKRLGTLDLSRNLNFLRLKY